MRNTAGSACRTSHGIPLRRTPGAPVLGNTRERLGKAVGYVAQQLGAIALLLLDQYGIAACAALGVLKQKIAQAAAAGLLT